ncbi:DUF3325 domain-containing protein [Marinibaculum pumilum]|uniref:DUF3325 domain-containing protein n=1 Tax=Marinibaculum pumilum TaxID=1766165 RepID=A0ABV7KWM3_9PROT
MTEVLALLLALLGFALLALAMHKHHRDILGRPLPPRRALGLRTAGWSLLALAFATSIAGAGWAIGPVLWFALITVAALAVAMMVTLRTPRRGR